MKVVIIGGVAGGASAAARLRRLDETAEIILLEQGEFISFANCGLPYAIGGDIREESALLLQTPESFFARFRVEVRVNTKAVSIDRDRKQVETVNLLTGETHFESYDKLILSPGAAPVLLHISGTDLPGVFTLRNIPDMKKIKEFIHTRKPRRVLIAGSGFIGLELAENMKQLGLEVTLAELSDHILPPLDFDMACDVQQYLLSQGVRLLLNQGIRKISRTEEDTLLAELTHDKLSTDMVILSVGVRPDSELAEKAGLSLNDRGAILVNRHMLTSDTDIYAVGDAVEVDHTVTKEKTMIPLAGPANKQGRIAADNICGLFTEYKGSQGSSILKLFEMTVAVTGINEKMAKASNIPYDKVFTYSQSHASYYPGARPISIKTIYEKKTGRILGAQLVGFEGVDKRCDLMAMAVRMKMTGFDLTEQEFCYAPPFSSAKDPVNFAGYVIENTLTGKVKNFHWHDIEGLPRDGSVTLLDVRTKAEYEGGHIEGFHWIPLDELREHIEEIPKEKPVYVHCHSGLRSYIACRILTGLGYDCWNLSGGYRLYASVISGKKAAEHACYRNGEA